MSSSRRPLAAHGQQRTPRAWTQLLVLVGVSVVVVLVSVAATGGFIFNNLTTSFAAGSETLEGQGEEPPNLSELEGGVNLLLVGVDECEPAYEQYFIGRCGNADDGGVRNDVNLLVHISDEPRRVTAITLPRDLMIPTPECTDAEGNVTSKSSKKMINTTMQAGGLNCVAKTVSELTGLDIPLAASITWGGVIEITNAIGGVDVCIASAIKDSHTQLDIPEGIHNFQGVEALQFLRTRYGVGDGSDIARVSNQQVYMSALVRKMLSSDVLSNMVTLLKLANTVFSNVRPSEYLSNPSVLVQMALAMKDVDMKDINFVQYPVFTDPDDTNRRVPDYASADILFDALANNKAIVVEGVGGGAVAADGGEGDGGEGDGGEGDGTETGEPVDGEVVDGGTDTATETPQVDDGTVVLPDNITGQNAFDETCSNGQIYG